MSDGKNDKKEIGSGKEATDSLFEMHVKKGNQGYPQCSANLYGQYVLAGKMDEIIGLLEKIATNLEEGNHD